MEIAKELCQNISGINDESVISAVKLASYDVCYRAGNLYFRSIDTINSDKETIKNVQIMVKRSLTFFSKHGPITLDGFKFKGAYTSTVSAGDGDFFLSICMKKIDSNHLHQKKRCRYLYQKN